jgi:hypothetical protein
MRDIWSDFNLVRHSPKDIITALLISQEELELALEEKDRWLWLKAARELRSISSAATKIQKDLEKEWGG